MSIRRVLCSAACFSAVILLSACQNDQSDGLALGASSDAPANAGPMSEKDQMRQREWQEAVRGIAFEDGRVVVTEPTGRNNPNVGMAHVRHGESLLAINHSVLAIGAYVEAVRDAPDLVEGYEGLGWALITKGKLDEALAAYETALDLDGDRVETLYEVAMIHARRQDFANATTSMHRVIAIDPEHAEAYERLAIFAYYQDDVETAREHAAKAEELGRAMPPQFMGLIE